jgi:hypothetical protein
LQAPTGTPGSGIATGGFACKKPHLLAACCSLSWLLPTGALHQLSGEVVIILVITRCILVINLNAGSAAAAAAAVAVAATMSIS